MSKSIGTPCETGVVNFLKAHGFPHAERRALTGTLDKGDIAGCIGICIEVKGGRAAEDASDGQIEKWLAETERERVNANADIGILVVKRRGISRTRAGEWWAVVDLGVLADLIYEPENGIKPFTRFFNTPARIHLATAVELLRDCGYGDPA